MSGLRIAIRQALLGCRVVQELKFISVGPESSLCVTLGWIRLVQSRSRRVTMGNNRYVSNSSSMSNEMMLSHQLQILMETRTYERLSPDSAASAKLIPTTPSPHDGVIFYEYLALVEIYTESLTSAWDSSVGPVVAAIRPSGQLSPPDLQLRSSFILFDTPRFSSQYSIRQVRSHPRSKIPARHRTPSA